MSRRGADWLSRARVAVDGQRQALRHRQPLATDLAKLRMRAAEAKKKAKAEALARGEKYVEEPEEPAEAAEDHG